MPAQGFALVFLMAALSTRCNRDNRTPDQRPDGSVAIRAPLTTDKLPAFTVSARLPPSATLLVSKKASRDELRTLIRTLKAAREQNRLSEMIPVSTPNGKLGMYAIVQIFVMSDPVWADQNHLVMALYGGSTPTFDRDFDAHTLASYAFSEVTNGEKGGLGAEGRKGYEKLF